MLPAPGELLSRAVTAKMASGDEGSSKLRVMREGSWDNWMSNLPQELRNMPVNYLTIPGSHDSFTYSLTSNSPVGPDEPEWIRGLAGACGVVVKPIIFRWSVTQRTTVAEQLRQGIRYFDIRLATMTSRKGIFIIHGLYGLPIAEVLLEVLQFMQSHPRELIFLDFQHFYRFTMDDHEWLITHIRELFGDMLCPVQPLKNLTLEVASKAGNCIVAIYRNQMTTGMMHLWPSGAFPNPWPNTLSIPHLFSFLEENVANRNADLCYITQCVLTPDAAFVFKHICATLQEKCGFPCNTQVAKWLAGQQPGPKGVNIVISDFVAMEGFPFVETVVGLNAKLLNSDTDLGEKDSI